MCAWFMWEAQLLPDTALYVGGGIGFFPSPLGRVIGSGGWLFLATANAIAGAAVMVLVAVLAHRLGGSAVWAAVIAFLTPLSLWTIFAGVDTLGVAFLLLAFVLYDAKLTRWALLSALVAVGVHLSLLPIVLVGVILSGQSWRRTLGVGIGVAAFAVLMLLVTPYGGVMASLHRPVSAIAVTALTLALAFLAYVPFGRRVLAGGSRARRMLAVLVAGIALGVCLQAQDRTTNMRYTLPLVMFLSAVVTCPYKGWKMTERGWINEAVEA